MKKIFLVVIPLLMLALLWVIFFWPVEKEYQVLDSQPQKRSSEFNLISSKGEVSLNDFKGKVVLIYFGYTWCPDVCPTNLSMMSGALSQLEADEVDQVQGLFISIDPERDNVKRLEEYTQFFHPKIQGLTGSKQQIDELAKRYGVSFRRVKQQESATDYVVDHSSMTYVIGKDGKLVGNLPHAALPEQILLMVREHL
ncbi:MAG: SCO family protein [Pseudomonadota bacterium]